MEALTWRLDNPSTALQQYYGLVQRYAGIQEDTDASEIRLSEARNNFETRKAEYAEACEKLTQLDGYKFRDEGEEEKKITNEADLCLSQIKEKYDSEIQNLQSTMQEDIEANDRKLQERLEKIVAGGTTSLDPTEEERQALAFEVERREITNVYEEKINQLTDSITQEKVDCSEAIGAWSNEQDEVKRKYNPEIDTYAASIERIVEKHRDGIEQSQQTIAEYEAIKNEKITEYDHKIEYLGNEADNEIAEEKKRHKKEVQQDRIRILRAKAQKKPTTQMENSLHSRERAFDDLTAKIQRQAKRKIGSVETERDKVVAGYDAKIAKEEASLNHKVQLQEDELAEPRMHCEQLTQQRDEELSALQRKVDDRLEKQNRTIKEREDQIEEETRQWELKCAKIDQKIIEYSKAQGVSHLDAMGEFGAPFQALQPKVDAWKQQAEAIKGSGKKGVIDVECGRQCEILKQKTYEELSDIAHEAAISNGKVSLLARSNKVFVLGGFIVVGIGLAVYLFMGLLKGWPGLILSVLGVILIAATVVMEKKECARICRYISLATDFDKFPGITSHSGQVVQKRELDRLKSLGARVFDVQFGKQEAQSQHDAKDADIKSDYERNVKLATQEYENERQKIIRDRDQEIYQIKSNIKAEGENYRNTKSGLQFSVKSLSGRITSLENDIHELQERIQHNKEFMEQFDMIYKDQFLPKLSDGSWFTSMKYTGGKLSDSLYIISEKEYTDKYGHRIVSKIEHNKKPFVVTYDSAGFSGDEESSMTRNRNGIEPILMDLLSSLYRMNDKELYEQFVIDEGICSEKVKNESMRKLFNIMTVKYDFDSIKSYLKDFQKEGNYYDKKGRSIDEINGEISSHGFIEAPHKYNIIYVIFGPETKNNSIDSDFERLLPDCEKKGFLPVFICDKSRWDSRGEEKGSIYAEIEKYVGNQVFPFDGTVYKKQKKEDS